MIRPAICLIKLPIRQLQQTRASICLIRRPCRCESSTSGKIKINRRIFQNRRPCCSERGQQKNEDQPAQLFPIRSTQPGKPFSFWQETSLFRQENRAAHFSGSPLWLLFQFFGFHKLIHAFEFVALFFQVFDHAFQCVGIVF